MHLSVHPTCEHIICVFPMARLANKELSSRIIWHFLAELKLNCWIADSEDRAGGLPSTSQKISEWDSGSFNHIISVLPTADHGEWCKDLLRESLELLLIWRILLNLWAPHSSFARPLDARLFKTAFYLTIDSDQRLVLPSSFVIYNFFPKFHTLHLIFLCQLLLLRGFIVRCQ